MLRRVAGSLSAALAVVAACGGPTARAGQGGDCYRDADCGYGLVCVAPEPGAARVCTDDVRNLVSTVDAGLPPNPAEPEGGAPADGGADSSSGGSAGTSAGNASGGSGGTSAGSAGASSGGTSAGDSGGNAGTSAGAAGDGGTSAGTAGQASSGGPSAGGGSGGAPATSGNGGTAEGA